MAGAPDALRDDALRREEYAFGRGPAFAAKREIGAVLAFVAFEPRDAPRALPPGHCASTEGGFSQGSIRNNQVVFHASGDQLHVGRHDKANISLIGRSGLKLYLDAAILLKRIRNSPLIPSGKHQLLGGIFSKPVPPRQEYDCGPPAGLNVRWESLSLEAGPAQRGPPAHPWRASPE